MARYAVAGVKAAVAVVAGCAAVRAAAGRGSGVTATMRSVEALFPGAEELGGLGAAWGAADARLWAPGTMDSRALLGGRGGGDLGGAPEVRARLMTSPEDATDDGGGGGCLAAEEGGVGSWLFLKLGGSTVGLTSVELGPDFKSAAPRAIASARMSLPASLEVSAARFNQRRASSVSPLVQKMSAVSRAETTSSLSSGFGAKMAGNAVILKT
jgi:hypothetical protein